MLCVSVHCDELCGRAHGHFTRKETRADGPGVRLGDTEPRGQKTSSCERYQASNWALIGRYGDLLPFEKLNSRMVRVNEN